MLLGNVMKEKLSKLTKINNNNYNKAIQANEVGGQQIVMQVLVE